MKKVTNLLFLTLCGGLFMVFALGSSSEVDSSEYNTDKIYSIGETLDCPAFDITVDKVEIKPNGTRINSFQVIDDPEWIGVILTVKNKSDETETFYGDDVNLINANGEVLEQSWLAYEIWGAELLDSPELVSGGSKTGYIQFANSSADNSNLTLQINCNTGLFDDDIIYKVNVSQ